MIHYALKCDDGHAFDGWFASSGAFDDQSERGLLECPVCGSAKVGRALMAPALAKGRSAPEAAPPRPEGAPSKQEILPPQSGGYVMDDERAAELRKAMRAIRQFVETNGVDVGRAFPEEARRIHYGEAEPRGIYGQAAPEEARELIEEGIEILPLPLIPDERN